MQISLSGKTAIVTGGAGGIGAATARMMAGAGARVVVADLDLDGAERVAAVIGRDGGTALAVRVDLADETQIESLASSAVEAFGGIDILHNNAAVSRAVVPDGALDRMRAEWWDGTFAVNLRGPMLVIKAVLASMTERGGGSIVNTSSTTSLLATGQLFAYSAAKAGLNQLTANAAALLGRRNIRCNAIAPGSVLTRRGLGALNERTFASMAREAALPRLIRPEDIAHAVTFLASDAAAAITGQVLAVDAGLTAHFGGWADLMREYQGPQFDAAAATWEQAQEIVRQAGDGA